MKARHPAQIARTLAKYTPSFNLRLPPFILAHRLGPFWYVPGVTAMM